MALKGSLTTFAMNKIVAHLLGKTAYTQPDPIYFAWHLATTLFTGVSSGGSTIQTVAPVAANANIIIAPFYGGATDLNIEQHVVLSVSGAGPYTLTLTTTLTSNHLAGAYVAFDPGDDCAQLLEPVGNAYARTSKVNNTTNFPAPSGGESDSGTVITWPSPTGTWGLATHAVALDALTSGIAWIYNALPSAIILDTTTAPPTLGTGNFILRAKKPS